MIRGRRRGLAYSTVSVPVPTEPVVPIPQSRICALSGTTGISDGRLLRSPRAPLGEGAVDSPVAATFEPRSPARGNASEQGIAQMVGSVERIAAQMSEVRSHVREVGAQIESLLRAPGPLPFGGSPRCLPRGSAARTRRRGPAGAFGAQSERRRNRRPCAPRGGKGSWRRRMLDDYLTPRMEISPSAGTTDEQRDEARRRAARFAFRIVFTDQPELVDEEAPPDP